MILRFYGKHFSWIDFWACLLIVVVGIALDWCGYFPRFVHLSNESKSIYSPLLGGFLSALAFLVTAQSIIYTVTPDRVIIRLKKSRGGKGLKELRNLFSSTIAALGIGFILSLLGHLMEQQPVSMIVGWLMAGTVLYLAVKLRHIFWLISQIGRHHFDGE